MPTVPEDAAAPRLLPGLSALVSPFTGTQSHTVRCLACPSTPGAHAATRPWITEPFTCLSVDLRKPRADADGVRIAAECIALRSRRGRDGGAPTLMPVGMPSFALHVEECVCAAFDGEDIEGYVCDNPSCSHVVPSSRGSAVRGQPPPWGPPRPGVNARRETRLVSTPPCLVLHMKRNQFAAMAGGHVKTDRRVNFAAQMHLGPLLGDPSAAHGLYDLVAVIEHLGGAYGGHYVTYRRVPTPLCCTAAGGEAAEHGTWVRASDDRVAPCSFEDVCAREAYMLFYARHNTRQLPSRNALVTTSRHAIPHRAVMQAVAPPRPPSITLPADASAALRDIWHRARLQLQLHTDVCAALRLAAADVRACMGALPEWMIPSAIALAHRLLASGTDATSGALTLARNSARGRAWTHADAAAWTRALRDVTERHEGDAFVLSCV